MKNNVKLFKPHTGQQKIIDGFVDLSTPEKWGVIVTGRQFGKTLLAINSMLYWLLSKPGMKGIWIAPYQAQATKVYHQFNEGASSVIEHRHSQEKRLVFGNGSELIFRSAENYEGLRGYTMDFGIIDEAAFVKEDAMPIIRPVFAVKAKKVMVISTPLTKNWFYKYYQEGLGGNKNYSSFHAISTDNPYFLQEEVDDARLTLPEDIIQQEYFAKFVEDGGDVFGNFGKCMVIEEYLEESDDDCYMGVDISLGKNDWSCVVIMDSTDVIYTERWKETITSNQVERIEAILERFNVKRGFIEINQERGIWQQISKINPLIKDWYTKKDNKPVMIQNLKKDIEDEAIGLPVSKLDRILFNEMSVYTQEFKEGGYIKYTHPPNGHDGS